MRGLLARKTEAVVPWSGPSVRLLSWMDAAVFADDAVRDPEAEAGAALSLGGEEGLEEVVADVRRDAWAVVGDFYDGSCLLGDAGMGRRRRAGA